MVGLRRDAYSPAAIEGRSARCNPGRHAAKGGERGRTKSLANHAPHRRWQALDAGRLPRLMGQGVQAGGGGRRDVSRSARHRSDATRDCWMHRGRDRDHHWTLAAQRARDHRHALPPPRSNARRERDPQARNANENSRLSARLLRDVLVKKGKHRGKSMAGGLGFEPRLTEPDPAFLPLTYPPPGKT